MRPTAVMAATVSEERVMDLSAEVSRVANCPYTPSLQVCVPTDLPTYLPLGHVLDLFYPVTALHQHGFLDFLFSCCPTCTPIRAENQATKCII